MQRVNFKMSKDDEVNSTMDKKLKMHLKTFFNTQMCRFDFW